MGNELPKLQPTQLANLFNRMARKAGLLGIINQHRLRRASRKLQSSLSAFHQYDLIAIAGGGLWGANALTKFGLIRAFDSLGLPVICYPFTAAWPMWEANTVRTLRNTFSLLHGPLAARESITLHRLKKIGLEPALYPDIAFRLHHRITRRPPDVLKEHKVLISVTKRRKRPPEKQRAIELRSRYRMTQKHTLGEENVAETVTRLKKAGLMPELITTTSAEDRDWMENIKKQKNINTSYPLTWQDFCAELQTASCLITNRLHGAILGLLSQTPVFLVADSDKTNGFSRQLPYGHSVDKLADLDIPTIISLLSNRDQTLRKQSAIVCSATRLLAEYNPLADVSKPGSTH